MTDLTSHLTDLDPLNVRPLCYPRGRKRGWKVIYTNTIVNGYVIEQRSHWTIEDAQAYADMVNANGATCNVYVRDRDREATVYPK